MQPMKKTNNSGIMPDFKSAIVFIIGLAIVNLIIIFLNDTFHSKPLMFFGNVIAIGFLFPATLLYVKRKEKFKIGRYLYFSFMTMMATGILMYLFVYRF